MRMGMRREEKYIRRQRSERSGGAKDEVAVEGPLVIIVIYFWLSVRFLEEIQPHLSLFAPVDKVSLLRIVH